MIMIRKIIYNWSYLLLLIIIIKTLIAPCHCNPTTTSTLPSPTSSLSITTTIRQNFIRNMITSAWNAYVRYGWGNGTVKPLAKLPGTRKNDRPAKTIVASLTTLWVAGLKEEFKCARDWVRDHLNFSRLEYFVHVASTVNEYLGPMLSCYALTGDIMFLNKARDIAQSLTLAYNVETGKLGIL